MVCPVVILGACLGSSVRQASLFIAQMGAAWAWQRPDIARPVAVHVGIEPPPPTSHFKRLLSAIAANNPTFLTGLDTAGAVGWPPAATCEVPTSMHRSASKR